MTRIVIDSGSGAMPANDAVPAAFRKLGCEPLGGPSTDGWSKLGEIQRCPYRYYLSHVAGAMPSDAMSALRPNLEIGSFLHAALAVHYGRLLPEGYPGWRANMPSPFEFFDTLRNLGVDRVCLQEAERLFSAYQEHYGVEEDFQPLAVEFPAGVPGVHTCRYDALIWHEGGLWVGEHKSASAAASAAAALESWWLDGEIMGEVYAYGLSNLEEVFGVPLAGVIVNLIFKTRPVKFQRLKIVIPPKVLQAYAKDRQWWGEQRERFKRTGHWPRALYGCSSRYDTCMYAAHCRDDDATALKFKDDDHD